MTTEPQPAPEQWAVLELMGHRQAIGKISTEDLAGRPMIRIDRIDTEPEGQVQLYGPESVYCLTPVTEEQARQIASTRYRTHVVPAALTAAADLDDDEDNDDEPRECQCRENQLYGTCGH